MWDAFKQLIFSVLLQIEAFVGDWGLAIIVLTVLLRIALMPLTLKQTKSMYEMQRVQPKLKELQNKYADDKEKQQEEMLKFYQENKVNPFGGCLPMILQMPVLFALYQVLGLGAKGKPGLMLQHLAESGEAGRFLGIIPDISRTPAAVYSADGIWAVLPYALLVVLFGLSAWLPQALMPGEKQQKMMGVYMGIMMLWFGWIAPAGVLLYWDVSSIWGIAQQQILMASMKKLHPQEPEPPVDKKAKKSLEDKQQAPTSKKSGKKKR